MRPEIQVEERSNTAARLVVGPLERGYGQTIGNALRRVLLSSIPGAAISAVQVVANLLADALCEEVPVLKAYRVKKD